MVLKHHNTQLMHKKLQTGNQNFSDKAKDRIVLLFFQHLFFSRKVVNAKLYEENPTCLVEVLMTAHLPFL
jgi:hypothetical protein